MRGGKNRRLSRRAGFFANRELPARRARRRGRRGRAFRCRMHAITHWTCEPAAPCRRPPPHRAAPSISPPGSLRARPGCGCWARSRSAWRCSPGSGRATATAATTSTAPTARRRPASSRSTRRCRRPRRPRRSRRCLYFRRFGREAPSRLHKLQDRRVAAPPKRKLTATPETLRGAAYSLGWAKATDNLTLGSRFRCRAEIESAIGVLVERVLQVVMHAIQGSESAAQRGRCTTEQSSTSFIRKRRSGGLHATQSAGCPAKMRAGAKFSCCRGRLVACRRRSRPGGAWVLLMPRGLARAGARPVRRSCP